MSARRSVSMASVVVWLCALAGGLLLWGAAPALAQRQHVFSFSFGSEGSGDGQLSQPGAIAVSEVGSAAGDVYVIDGGNGRVEVFSATGAYVTQFNGSASPTGAFTATAIAVDDSTNPLDPSAGDVYVADSAHNVIDKFSGSGAYLGQVAVAAKGLAVDANGVLWVQVLDSYSQLDEFNDAATNELISQEEVKFKASTSESGHLGAIGVAIDSAGDLYFGHPRGLSTAEVRHVIEFDSEGVIVQEEVGGEGPATGVAVDRSSNDVYIDRGSSVEAFDPSGFAIESFGSGELNASTGVAVNSSTGAVYTSDAATQTIDVFTSFIVPDVTTGAASSLQETSATVGGVVDPDGLPVTSCVFEYGTTSAYGQEAPCSANPGSGDAPVAVSASLSGLEPLTRYHFRLRASNANGSNVGKDRSFLTPVPVALSEEGVTDVSSVSAQFSANVNPGGADTRFHFEYGPTASYGQSVPVPEGDLGAVTGVEPVSVRPEGLQPGTTYHVRIAATNVLGTVYGPDQTFTTQSLGGAFVLPDGRVWEMVSPPNKYGAGIEAFPAEGVVEAAEDGSAISYVANGPILASPAGNPSPFVPTQVLSRRGAAGWSSQDIVSPAATVGAVSNSASEFLSFSPDLSQGLVEPKSLTPLAPEATERTVYLRDDNTGSYLPLVTSGNVPPGTKIYGSEIGEQVHGLLGTPDLSHVLLESHVALTSDAVKGGENIYEWSDGRLVLVSPVGRLGQNGQSVRHALSNDGSRVFLEVSGGVEMVDTVTGQSVLLPGSTGSGQSFQIASATGSKVFYLAEDGDLDVYDTEASIATDLTVDPHSGESANARRVLGASEDGTVVYFLATGALAEGAQAGADNLYVVSESGSTWSAPRLIAVLSAEDEPTWKGFGANLASQVSTNGRFLAFMSDRSLTGYDNRDAVSGMPDEEVFVYDAASGGLRCVSCNPTGARPTGIVYEQGEPPFDRQGLWPGHWLAALIPGWDVAISSPSELSYQSRYLTDEGRLFFDSFDALAPQDTNGQADVYEYEPERVGGCEQAEGCVSLISAGTSSKESLFLDSSGRGPGGGEGEDVFFLTASRLTSQDYDSSMDVYDAHVCSSAVPCVTQPVSPPECTSGDSCKAAPSPQPAIFGAPASATFAGAGNLPAPPPAAAPKRRSKQPAKHQKKHSRKRKARRSRTHLVSLTSGSGRDGQRRGR